MPGKVCLAFFKFMQNWRQGSLFDKEGNMNKFFCLAFAFLLTSMAMAQSDGCGDLLFTDNAEQSVKAGGKIDPIAYECSFRSPEDAMFWVDGLVEGLDLQIDLNTHLCSISGFVSASMPIGVYEQNAHVNECEQKSVIKVTETDMFKWVSGSLNQTVMAGNAIEPVVIWYGRDASIKLSNVPQGVKTSYDQEAQTISISGTLGEGLHDKVYEYELFDELQNVKVAVGSFSVVHKPVVTTIETVENATQTVMAGDSIKPIVFKYAHMQRMGVSGIPETVVYAVDTAAKTVTLTGSIPEDYGDVEFNVAITAKGADNNATAYATIKVVHKPKKTDVTLVSDNVTQTVVAGMEIDPLVFKYESIDSLWVEGLPGGEYKIKSTGESRTSMLVGTVAASASVGIYNVMIIARGLLNNDTAKAVLVVEAYSSSSVSSSSVESSSSQSSSSVSSSSAAQSSSSETSSSSAASSSSVESSSSAESSSSEESSSSSVEESSSSEEHTTLVVAGVVNSLKVSLAGRQLHVSGVDYASVDVFDMQGCPVASFKQVAGSVSLESLRQGNYIVRVRSGSMNLARRIAIK